MFQRSEVLKNKLIRYLPSLVWMGVIFYLSSRSTAVITGTNQTRFIILKTFHLIEYSILAILLFISTKKYHRALLIGYLYAVSDEIHQYFVPGRNARVQDTLIDFVGLTIGLLLVRKLIRLKCLKKILIALY